jgi:sulfate permease, SulP family
MSFNMLGGLLPIKPREVARDAVAGLTLASMNIPQVLGYTRIAGTPVITGLYTVLLPLVGFAVFGSSRHLVVAADSATAAIFASSLSRMAPLASEKYMTLVGVLTLLTAGLLLLARIFKLGFLADFLSRTALVGFLSGVGIQVGVAMLGDMLGVAVHSERTLFQLEEVALALPKLNVLAFGLSIIVVTAILLGRRFAPRFPVPLLVVIGMIAASAWLHLAEEVAVIGPVPGGLPSLQWPVVSWRETLDLLQVAISCFVMIIAQSAATSRVYALLHKERVDENADILGLAAANVGAAVSGAFVVNGSPTQTAMAHGAGARSQVAQLTFVLIVVIVLLLLTGPLQYLPHCVLASVVFTIAVGMIDVKGLKAIMHESRGEFLLALFTAAAVPGIGVEQGILLAIALSLVRHVRHSYRPHTMVLAPNAQGRWTPTVPKPGIETEPGLIVYRFGADLFYANADRFADEALALIDGAPAPVRRFVVDASAMTDIDYSAARTLRDFIAELAARKVQIVFGRVSPSLRADMQRHNIAATLGEEHIFSTLHEALAAARSDEASLSPL